MGKMTAMYLLLVAFKLFIMGLITGFIGGIIGMILTIFMAMIGSIIGWLTSLVLFAYALINYKSWVFKKTF